jgi:hypothetical protein
MNECTVLLEHKGGVVQQQSCLDAVRFSYVSIKITIISALQDVFGRGPWYFTFLAKGSGK